MTFDYDNAQRIIRRARLAADLRDSDRAAAVDELLALDAALATRLTDLHERGEAITREIRGSAPDDVRLEELEQEITHRDIELAMLQELAAEVASAAEAFHPPADLGPVH